MTSFNNIQGSKYHDSVSYLDDSIYNLDLQIKEETLNFGPVPGRTSGRCTLVQCKTQQSTSDCLSCWDFCRKR